MSAKKTTKKVAKKAAKKAAKKTAQVKDEPLASVAYDPKSSSSLVLKRRLPADNKELFTRMQANVTKTVSILVNRSSKRPVSHMSVAQMRKLMVQVEDLYPQFAIGAVGFRTPTIMEVIAPEASGKTTWAYSMIGQLADMGCYSIYIGCEEKTMEPAHVERLLDTNKAEANRKLNMLSQWRATQLVECDEVLIRTVEETRKRCDADPVTKGNPIWVFIDTWSSLMSSTEAAGRSGWGVGEGDKKAVRKDAGTGSNMGHAKHMQIMKRWLPDFISKNNCSVVFFNHQNVKVDMGPKRGPQVQISESMNDTTIGGRGLRSIASYRMTMIPEKVLKNTAGVVIGQRVKVTFIKNSFGPPRRSYKLDIIYEPTEWCDTRETYDQVVRYHETTADWMVDKGLLGTTVNKKRYTCDVLGCVAVKSKALYEALLKNPEQLNFLGGVLHLDGYAGADEATVVSGIEEGSSHAALDEEPDDNEEAMEEEGDDDDDAS